MNRALLTKLKSHLAACAVAAVSLACGLLLCACAGSGEVDLDAMHLVTYEANGGYIDGYTVREVYYEENSFLMAPATGEISASRLGKITRKGYVLEGWYTAQNEGYVQSDNGDYVKLDATYERDNEGDYVLIYEKDEAGKYVLVSETDAEGNVSEHYAFYKPDLPEHAELERYTEHFVIYNEKEHEDLMRYRREDTMAYGVYGDLFEEDYNGDYVKAGESYTYDPEHTATGIRYGLAPYFESEGVDLTTAERYDAAFTYEEGDKWDFARNRMPADDIILYANWQQALTLTYLYPDGYSVSIFNGNRRGAPVQKTTSTRQVGGMSFDCWSRDESDEDYTPWDFETDVFPEDATVLVLYAKYKPIEIGTVADLKLIGQNPTGQFRLIADIDCGGASNPLGVSSSTVFTGTIHGDGHTISNFSVNGFNKNSSDASIGLLGETNGAVIKDLTVRDMTVSVSIGSRGGFLIGGIAGKDQKGSVVENCDASYRIVSSGTCSINLVCGSVFGMPADDTVTENCKGSFNTDGFTTSGTVTDADAKPAAN